MARKNGTIHVMWRTTVDPQNMKDVTEFMRDFTTELHDVAAILELEETLKDSRLAVAFEMGEHTGPNCQTNQVLQKIIEYLDDLDRGVEPPKEKVIAIPKGVHGSGSSNVNGDGLHLTQELMDMAAEFVERNRKRSETELFETDEHQRGVYNGMEHLLAALTHRAPSLRMPDGTYKNGRMWDGEFE